MALRKFLHAKLHRATITHADLDYEGSLTLPPDLMDRALIAENESVHVWNISNGNRFETYALRGQEASRAICANGAAAHLARPGDLVIVAVYCFLTPEEASIHRPNLVFLGPNNEIAQCSGDEVPGPQMRK